MYAVVIEGGRLAWQERPDPAPAGDELLVGVRAAGVNGADIAQSRGQYPAPPGYPQDIPGLELAGEVIDVGEKVTRFVPGDRVMGLVGGAAQATLAVLPESHALPLPSDLSWPEGGGFPEAFFTAYDALFAQAGLLMSERVLVTGAAGGVGTAAVQLGAATGAHVIAGVRDASFRDAVLALGAAAAIDHSAIAANGPYDVVLELVGATSLAAALPALATGGRAVVIGVGGDARLELDLLALMRTRAQLRASTLRARPLPEKATLTAAVARSVLPLLADGRIRVPVFETFAMSEAAAAYERFAAGGKFGKIVLET